jgi:hypothetical protein
MRVIARRALGASDNPQVSDLNQSFSNCRAITTRWIWLVPS